MNYKAMMAEIKSELLDLWNAADGEKTYSEWFEILKPRLSYYFGIDQSEFFIYSHQQKGFLPCKKNRQCIKQRDVISVELIVGTKTQSKIQIFKDRGFEFTDDYLLFTDQELNPLGILLVDAAEGWRNFITSSSRGDLESTLNNFIQNIRKVRELTKKERKFRLLFNVTESFNATMESHLILDGIMDQINDAFPSLDTELILTQDQEGLTYAYKQFDHTKERLSTVEAFLSGEITIENAVDLNVELINIPIKGRQGTYGLVQLKNACATPLTIAQKNFGWMLAKAAGSALENANLYDQSHRLIEDLRLVNETSHKLNSGMHFDEMIGFLKQQLVSALQPDEICFVFNDKNKTCEAIDASTDYFMTVGGQRYINYVENHFVKERPALFEANLAETETGDWPYKAIIGLPILDQEETIGFVICLHKVEYFFSFDQFKLMRSLIGHSSLAIANLLLRNQLRALAEKDYLTGLYARRYLDDAVQDSIERDAGGTFVLFDIDDFKKVNDTYGHNVGDEVLKQVSNYIIKEIPKGATAARWGGEEVAIYLPGANPEQARLLSEKLVVGIPTVTEPSVTISAGLANWSVGEAIELKELLKQADTVLYQAKRSGKNQLVIHA